MRTPLVALALGLAVPSPAFALSCIWGPHASLPAHDATDVATDTRITILVEGDGVEASMVELVDEDANAVAFDLEFLDQGSQQVVILTPDAELAADTAYRVTIGGDFAYELSFTTGAGPDEDAPDSPVVLDTKIDRGRSVWGSTHMVGVELENPSEPVVVELALTDVSTGEDLGTIHQIPWTGDATTYVSAGEGLCTSTAELDGAVHVEVTFIDASGNRSETPPEEKAGGCSSLGAPATFSMLGLALGLTLLRRRRE